MQHKKSKCVDLWLYNSWIFSGDYFKFLFIFYHVSFEDKLSTIFRCTTIWTILAWFCSLYLTIISRGVDFLLFNSWIFCGEHWKFIFIFITWSLKINYPQFFNNQLFQLYKRDFTVLMQHKKSKCVDLWLFNSWIFCGEYLKFLFIFYHVSFEDKLSTIFRYTTIWTIIACFCYLYWKHIIQWCWFLGIQFLDILWWIFKVSIYILPREFWRYIIHNFSINNYYNFIRVIS
jgi:hypothetical protein